MDDHNSSTFNYLGEEMLLTQFSILANNIQKALPPGHEGSKSIADQIKCLKTKHEKWSEKIIQTWLKRNIPVFSSEAVTKLIQAYCSMVEEVNESQKRQKESLRADINRKKKQLDDIARGQTVHIACTGEMRLYQPHTFEYFQL